MEGKCVMADNVFLLLGGALQTVICGVLLYIAGRISKLYELMLNKVSKSDCQYDMCKHEKELQNLWETSRDHEKRISKLE